MSLQENKKILINKLKDSKNFFSKASRNAFIKKINIAKQTTFNKLENISNYILEGKINFKVKDLKNLLSDISNFNKIKNSLLTYSFQYDINNFYNSVEEVNNKVSELRQENPNSQFYISRIFENQDFNQTIKINFNKETISYILFWFHHIESNKLYAEEYYEDEKNENKIYKVKIQIFNNVNIEESENIRLLQKFSDSQDEILCVPQSIIKFCKSNWNTDTRKIYNKITTPIYNKKYTIEDLEELAKYLNVSFEIIDFFNDPIKINYGNGNKNSYCIELLNIKFDHLEYSEKNSKEISGKDSLEIMNNSKYYFKTGNKLKVLDCEYEIKNDFGPIFNNFTKSNNLNHNFIKVDSEEFKYIQSYNILLHRIFNKKLIEEYNENKYIIGEKDDDLGVDGKITTIIENKYLDDDYIEYDLHKAYFNGTNQSEYGAPSNAFLYYDSEYKNQIETHIKNNFVGFYNITLLNKIDYIFETLTHTLTTPQIMILIKHNIKFVINSCLIAPKINIKFSEETKGKVNEFGDISERGVSIYSKISGILMKNEIVKTTEIKTDNTDEYVKILNNNNINVSHNGEIIKIDKPKNISMKHIGVFINSNTSAIVLDCLLENYKNINNIMGVKLDSIIVKKSDYKFVHSDLFKEKKARLKNILTYESSPFIEEREFINNCKELKFNNDLVKSNFILLSGKGGSGKTESIFNNVNQNEIIYVSLAWERGADIRNKYNENIIISSIPKILDKNEVMPNTLKKKSYFKYIVIDEITLISEETILEIQKLYPDKIIILIGDVDEDGFYYQCSLDIMENFKVINPSNHNIQVIKYTKNYRFTQELNNKLDELRNEMRTISQKFKPDIIRKKKISEFVENKFKSCFYKKEQIKFNKNDMGIACLQESKINFKYTKYFLNEDNKKYVVEKTRILSNIFKGNETDEKNGELRLFSTIHATQGKTCPIGNNVIIIIDKYFDFNLYYTALSRAKTLNQIYIIKDFN